MCAKKGEKILECIYVPKDKQLTLKIAEEIDEHTTEKLRRKIDNEITRFLPRKVIFDFSNGQCRNRNVARKIQGY